MQRRTTRSARSIATGVAASALTLALAACGGSDGSESAGSVDTTVTATSQTTESGSPTTTTASATTSAHTATAPSPTSSTQGPASGDRLPNLGHKTSQASFASPSGKIACTYSASGREEWVRCDLRGAVLDVPEQAEEDCEFDLGTSLYVDASGGRLNCVSVVVQGTPVADAADSAMWWEPAHGTSPQGEVALPYGKSLGISTLLCESRRSGMTCTVGEHGFTLNDSAYDVW